MFEIELIICIKMDLALNNLKRLICYKTQTTNQPNQFIMWFLYSKKMYVYYLAYEVMLMQMRISKPIGKT